MNKQGPTTIHLPKLPKPPPPPKAPVPVPMWPPASLDTAIQTGKIAGESAARITIWLMELFR